MPKKEYTYRLCTTSLFHQNNPNNPWSKAYFKNFFKQFFFKNSKNLVKSLFEIFNANMNSVFLYSHLLYFEFLFNILFSPYR
jgi:hypothetical protein